MKADIWVSYQLWGRRTLMKPLIQDIFLFLPKIRDVIKMQQHAVPKVFCMSLVSERLYSIYQCGMNLCEILHCTYHMQSQKPFSMILCREEKINKRWAKAKATTRSWSLPALMHLRFPSVLTLHQSWHSISLTRSHRGSLLPALSHPCHPLTYSVALITSHMN